MQLDLVLNLYRGVERLKKTTRRGWELKNIPNPESVADHVYGVSTLALVLAQKRGLDIAKVALISVLHDVCEIKIGDITPNEMPVKEKQKLEREAAKEVLTELDDTGKLFDLWTEYADETTDEGRFVKDIDRLEMALQAYCYEEEGNSGLDEFFEYSKERIADVEIRSLLDELIERRSNE